MFMICRDSLHELLTMGDRRCLAVYFVFLLCVSSASARQAKAKSDLPADAKLRVGIKHRPVECTRKSAKGDALTLHYVGALRKTGKQFDSSRDRDSPFRFTLGAGQVIKGWDQGLLAMCTGEKRRLTVPSGLAYGDRGSAPTIPGGATLIFDVELMAIE